MTGAKIKILHITPHLGGGVGKAISGILTQVRNTAANYEHEVLCLSSPQNYQFINIIRKTNCNIIYGNSKSFLAEKIRNSDILQLEFWNHPLILKALCNQMLPPHRLAVWCHISGNYFPKIPFKFLTDVDNFFFTSRCSYSTPEVQKAIIEGAANINIISSGGGLNSLPKPGKRKINTPLRYGYAGSLNFSKLHPNFIDCLSKVMEPHFQVRIIGETVNRDVLSRQCREINKPDLINFCNYTTNIASELNNLDVMIYLLNPYHYGTAENTLLEAMAMGVVPIVLKNGAENEIVVNNITGLCLNNLSELPPAIKWLSMNRDKHYEMAKTCEKLVRTKYNYRKSLKLFHSHYESMVNHEKKSVDFRTIFGHKPSEWFLSFVRDKSIFMEDGTVNLPAEDKLYGFSELTKGSVLHFSEFFPDDTLLKEWSKNLRLQNIKPY